MVELIFVFKAFKTEKVPAEMALVAGATNINFINLKRSAKISRFNAGDALKELIQSDSDKQFEHLRISRKIFN